MLIIAGPILILLCFSAGLLGTVAIERASGRLGLVQAPNERSSHVKPTARGGGLAIAATALVAWALYASLGYGTGWVVVLLIGMTAILGFADDLRGLSAGLRFPVQIAIIAILVWSASPLPALPAFAGTNIAGPLLAGLVLLAGLWWINLFNFMDGIDGLAATQAILLLLCGSAILISSQAEGAAQATVWLVLAVAAATAGFLIRNWPPARIFMGDAGSTVLALVIFAFALQTISAGWMSYPAWLILPCVFVADASITIARRTARGERPWRAHRRHAYQQLSRLWGHKTITVGYGSITLFWAFPLAYAAEQATDLAWWLVLAAYLPLFGMMGWAGAGGAEETHPS